jgi:hypothetical protein
MEIVKGTHIVKIKETTNNGFVAQHFQSFNDGNQMQLRLVNSKFGCNTEKAAIKWANKQLGI